MNEGATRARTNARRGWQPLRVWRCFLGWLRQVPVRDPLERLNAPMLQAVLALYVLGHVVLAVLRWSGARQTGLDLPFELFMVACIGVALVCFVLVRSGQFRLAAGLLIANVLALIAVEYLRRGLVVPLGVQLLQVFPVVLGGLLLGRRALWIITGAVMAMLVLGVVVDLASAGDIVALRRLIVLNWLGASFGCVLIAAVLDRAMSTLRASLATAVHRGKELARIRRRLEREMEDNRRTQAKLLHAQKMEAMGRLASGVAHDFNNILGVISGYVGRAESSLEPEVAEASLDGIRAAVQRGTQVTQRLLTLGRRQPREVHALDVVQAVRETLPMLRQIFRDGKPVQLRVELTDAALPVRLDRAEFELALLNLAANARDAMPDGGEFAVGIEARGGANGADWVALTFSDTGCGMQDDVVVRMFDPFFTTKPGGKGTGIGLAEVRRTVDAAGGRIEVDSRPGHGTRIAVLLPLLHAPAVALHGRRVLLVDDEPEMRALVAAMLRERGGVVVAAGSGEEAERLAAAATGIEHIVCDLDLPDVDGAQLLVALRSRFPAAAALLISGNAMRLADAARGAGCAALAKPFDADALCNAMRVG